MAELPNIERLWNAVNAFQSDTRTVIAGREPGSWEHGFIQARAKFKGALAALDIADKFDWTEE